MPQSKNGSNHKEWYIDQINWDDNYDHIEKEYL